MSVPLEHAWNEHQPAVDEQEFTPWAEKGWLSHNGQSPEIAVCDFVRTLVRMMCPALVIETGVGQGYMTRTIVTALCNGGMLRAFESDDEWREMIWTQQFWTDRRFTAVIAPEPTPAYEEFAQADLCVIDSDFSFRFAEIVAWHEYAKPGAVALIHDTSDREGTIHRSVRELIVELGMVGAFLQNPRGCFLAVQPKGGVMPVSYSEQSSGPSTRQADQEDPSVDAPWKVTLDYSMFNKGALQEMAATRGLSTAGNKADLIERLTA